MVVLDGSSLPQRAEVGGKAWSIAWMRQLALPVPPAFVLTTEACRDYYDRGLVVSDEVWAAARRGIAGLEEASGKRFGGERPLLVSVRSGASVSMPGMMDTILNLGMNDDVEEHLRAMSGNGAHARETHCRFLESYGRIVLKSEPIGADGTPSRLRELIEDDCGEAVPIDVWAQLKGAIGAVFASWMTPRARAYRRHWGIAEDGGTAVTIQAMVFGNLDETSGTGVFFTRNPLSGEPVPYGEYMARRQGEDIVSGEHDPVSLSELEREMPEVHRELIRGGSTLETETGEPQDIEFTIESGRLYLLQARAAKRSPRAAVRIAVDLVAEGILSPEAALRQVTPDQLRNLLRPRIAPEARCSATVLARGEPACPGVASGLVAVDSNEAECLSRAGVDVVLALPVTSPEDVHGMIAARAICTEKGGSTSHAAVVSRALGRPSVVGCGKGTVMTLAGRQVTIDGATGEVFDGIVELEQMSPENDDHLRQISQWAIDRAPLRVVSSSVAIQDKIVDLDELGVVDADDVADALTSGGGVARGAVFESDAGVAAALEAGVTTIVADPPLPVLLAAIRAQESRSSTVALAIPPLSHIVTKP